MFDAKLRISFVLAAVLTAATATAAAADCKSKTADFDSAVSAKSINQVAAAYNVIQKDSDCDFDIDDLSSARHQRHDRRALGSRASGGPRGGDEVSPPKTWKSPATGRSPNNSETILPPSDSGSRRWSGMSAA